MKELEKFLLKMIEKKYPGFENYVVNFDKDLIIFGEDFEDPVEIPINSFIDALKTDK